jgi:hypothetical protein
VDSEAEEPSLCGEPVRHISGYEYDWPFADMAIGDRRILHCPDLTERILDTARQASGRFYNAGKRFWVSSPAHETVLIIRKADVEGPPPVVYGVITRATPEEFKRLSTRATRTRYTEEFKRLSTRATRTQYTPQL